MVRVMRACLCVERVVTMAAIDRRERKWELFTNFVTIDCSID